MSTGAPLSELLERYEGERDDRESARHLFLDDSSRAIDLSRSAGEVGIRNGHTIQFVEGEIQGNFTADTKLGGKRQRVSSLKTPYGAKLGEWLADTLHLRGGYGDRPVYPEYEECEREMVAAAKFAPLLRQYLDVTNEDPKYTSGPYALLVCHDEDASKAHFIFATEWFCEVVNRTREDLAGSSWSTIYENATAMKQRYWQLMGEQPSGLATRFPYLHPHLGEVMLAIHAEPIVFWFPTESVHIIAVAINDISGYEEGISSRDRDPGEEELDFTDVLIGAANIDDTMHRKTVQSNFDFMQHIIFNARTAMSDALMHAFPDFDNYTTVVNHHQRWQKEYLRIKPLHERINMSDVALMNEDDIYTENVDEICEQLGEWYRDYRQENLELLAKIREGRDQVPSHRVDTCEEPPGRMPNDSSLEIARRMMGEMARGGGRRSLPATIEDDGLRLPIGGSCSRMMDDDSD